MRERNQHGCASHVPGSALARFSTLDGDPGRLPRIRRGQERARRVKRGLRRVPAECNYDSKALPALRRQRAGR